MDNTEPKSHQERVLPLLDAYDAIQSLWYELGPELEQMKGSQEVEVQHVLDLAERLSYTAHAPIGWKEGFPLINKFPPAPQPDQMRMGKLAELKLPEQEVAKTKGEKKNDKNAVTDQDLQYVRNSIKQKLAEQRSRMDVESMASSRVPEHSLTEQPTQKKARTKVNIKFDVDSDSDS